MVAGEVLKIDLLMLSENMKKGVDAIASYGTKRGDLDFYIEAAT